MPFPDSYTMFDRIDVSNSVDMVERLDQIVAMLDDNTSDLSILKGNSTEIKDCVSKLCTDEVLDSVNDMGWRLMV